MIKLKNIGKNIPLPISPLFQKVIWKRRFDDAFKTGSTVEELNIILRELKKHQNDF